MSPWRQWFPRPSCVGRLLRAAPSTGAARRDCGPFCFSPWALSDRQNFGARRGLQFTRIHRHRQQAVIADGAGQLNEPVVAEPPLHRPESRVIDAVPAEKLTGKLDNLGVFGWNAARMVIADRRYRRLRHPEP